MGKSEGRRFAAEPAGRLERYGWAGCAVVAPGFALVSDQATHRVWGWTAGAGYALAALLSSGPRPRPAAARAAAVLGAVLVPLAGLVAAGLAQSEVAVVERSGQLLRATGSPYLSAPVAVGDFNPYLPGMAVFGVLPGDARWWLGGVCAACLAGVGLGRAALLACPLVALPFAVGGVDLPVVGLMCLGVVLAGRGRPGRAGLALGAAAALKWTAWPALPVALVLVTAARGGRSALRYAATGSGTAAAVVLPFVLLDPAGFQRNVVAFPLGLTSAASPAESPLPGRLLASYVPGGTVIALVLLAAAALLTGVSLVLRPPGTAPAAAARLALGLALATALMPATRFGYLVYPLVLGALAYRERHAAPSVPEVPARRPTRAGAEVVA
ncbi:glycosyltransferase 87 family protein [Streptomyces parvulus]|uniref:glycosyltransferase 87 family protein n=1 Tax=Streptomyces parvulus TaxID=146923 RepID=UPI001CF988CF|nr:glycosyltransferase 87 family protein [Streptomyces parvulus]MCQ4193569.1 glycosyltransferase 87 family protein [Streptomyces parvulus]